MQKITIGYNLWNNYVKKMDCATETHTGYFMFAGMKYKHLKNTNYDMVSFSTLEEQNWMITMRLFFTNTFMQETYRNIFIIKFVPGQ